MSSTTSTQKFTREKPAGNGYGNRPRAIKFVDLVFESDAIVVGRVADMGPPGLTGSPEDLNFEVARSFRRSLPKQINVRIAVDGESNVTFRKGEHAALFLDRVDDKSGTLFGYGDVGKWPRIEADWVFTPGHVQPLEQVVRVIESLLQTDEMNRYEDRAAALTNSPFVDNDLGRIAALQYAMDDERWHEEQMHDEISLRIVQNLLSAVTLLEKKPLDFAAEVELFQLLEQAPLSVAIPKWIEGLAHPDVAMRDTAIAALQTAVDEDFEYDSRQAENQRAEAVKRWRKWFDKHFFDFLKQDVPELLDELRSDAMLRRKTANLLLRVISGQDVGFLAEDEKSKREAAAERWEKWWKKSSM